MNRDRLRVYLEYQADRVEAVLAAHRAPVRITGGRSGPRQVRFYLSLASSVRLANVQRLSEDLALALRVPAVTITRGKEGVILTFDNPDPTPVTLRGILEGAPRAVPVSTMLLGVTADGDVSAVRLADPRVAHVLVSGTTGSGKSTLLQAMATSLAWFNRPDVLQLVFMSPKRETFGVFAGLRHTVGVFTDAAEAAERLRSLVLLMQQRDRRGLSPGPGVPRVVVFIDELAALVMGDSSGTKSSITDLVQGGRQVGIHVVAATQHPKSAILGGVMRANFPLRVVGKVVSAEDARMGAGRGGTNAHLLGGKGDFLGVAPNGENVRLQGAMVTVEEIQELLSAAYADADAAPVLTLPRVAMLRDLTDNSRNVAAQRDRVQEAVAALSPHWPKLRGYWREKVRGIKSGMVRAVWGRDHRYEGSFARWIDAAAVRMEEAWQLEQAGRSAVTVEASVYEVATPYGQIEVQPKGRL